MNALQLILMVESLLLVWQVTVYKFSVITQSDTYKSAEKAVCSQWLLL